jgi:hypothetical protein
VPSLVKISPVVLEMTPDILFHSMIFFSIFSLDICNLDFLARQDDCLESYCHDPRVGVGVTPQGKNFNLGYIF